MAKIDYETMVDLLYSMGVFMEKLSLEMSIWQVNEAYRLGKPMRFQCEDCGVWSGDVSGEELFEVATPYTCPSCEDDFDPEADM